MTEKRLATPSPGGKPSNGVDAIADTHLTYTRSNDHQVDFFVEARRLMRIICGGFPSTHASAPSVLVDEDDAGRLKGCGDLCERCPFAHSPHLLKPLSQPRGVHQTNHHFGRVRLA